ncbi:MAG: hypothetical protein AMXMBFR83_13310 [Phycisphaerae bacterium]
MVAWAERGGHQLVPAGAGTKRHWTSPPHGPAVALDLRGLSRVVEYSPEDMTITVEAGITLGALQEHLARNGQRLTLDPPHPDRATIGGILAANDSGPIRFGFGTARDIVIGMSMIQPDGEIIRSGGKVVKNVAGYDLHKLYIGSFGTLGPIATVTFRLRPVPEARGLVVLAPADAVEAEQMIATTLAGRTRPVMIELLNARMAATVGLPARLTLVIGFEDNAEAVRWQCATLVQELGGAPLGPAEGRRVYQALCEAAGADVATSFKAAVPGSETAGFVQRADRRPMRLIARAGNGIVYGLLEEPMPDEAWRDLEERTAACGGSLHLRGRLPGAILPRFGRRRGDAWLSEDIQRAFDPQATFAPERLGFAAVS